MKYKETINQSTIKKIEATVISVTSNNTKATIKLLNETSSVITLYNKTGEFLSVGDHVWVHYWTMVTDGYIAIRCGNPDYSDGDFSDGEPYVGDLPLSQRTRINTAYILTENTKEYKTIYSYETTDQSGSSTLANVNVGNIDASWSAQFNHNVYMTSCEMSNGSLLYFTWVPRVIGTGSAEANLYVYNDITIPEIVNNEIVNRRYYIKAIQQSNNKYSINIAMIENGSETLLTMLQDNVAYEDISNYKFVFVVGINETEENNTTHIVKYNSVVNVHEIDTKIYQAYYNENTGLWGVVETYVTWSQRCVIASKPIYINVGIYKQLVTQSKERSEIV